MVPPYHRWKWWWLGEWCKWHCWLTTCIRRLHIPYSEDPYHIISLPYPYYITNGLVPPNHITCLGLVLMFWNGHIDRSVAMAAASAAEMDAFTAGKVLWGVSSYCLASRSYVRVPMNGGYPHSCMVFVRENLMKRLWTWMITGGTSVSGNLHVGL